VLTTPRVRRIAIANPDHAPYGRAAVAALRHERVYEQVQAKLVRGENISQAAQFVQSGNADVGVVALSLALSPALAGAGTYAEIPDGEYPPIEQAAVVLAGARNKAAAGRFLQFLKAPETVRLLQSFGFVLPQPGRR
jgi:molybdate transport system substrate-binding protein